MTPAERRHRVLIIDDDAIVRLMAAEALTDAGYDVIEAIDAEAGLERFDRSGVGLVLLDVLLPGMNGFEACARLRAHAAGANVPIIVMTGLDDQQSIAKAYDSGATDFITKPIVWDLLPYRVRYALRASEAFQETVRSRALLSRSQSLANMGSWEWRRDDDTIAWSEEMHRILDTAPAPIDVPAAKALLANVHADDQAMVRRALTGALDQGLAYDVEFRIVRADGTVRRLFEQVEVERRADGAVSAVRGIRRDITKQAEADERIRTLAFFDPLTGLANRALFRNMVQYRMSQVLRHGLRCAVLVIDIDRFKVINETFGPRAGDEVLKVVGQRLGECLRAADPKGSTHMQAAEENIARLGGDEFMVLIGEIADPGHASLVAERIVRVLSEPIVIGDHEINLGASIGIGMAPEHGQDTDTLLRNASAAMHAAKQDALHRIRFFDGAMSVASHRKGMLETELRRAVQLGELRVYYQAKVDIRSLHVVGAEALLRWMHPTLGLTGPMEFIPIAEESGLIVAVTRFVITEVCRQMAEWRDAGRRMSPVSVNLDALSLQRDDLVAFVSDALARHALPASAIEFEVTEGSLMRDMGRACRTLEQLRAMGVKLSIDDFGTGYSSLTYLKRFPVDVLKIDRSFIKDLPRDGSDAALATAVIAMGHSLNLELIAEGVETWEQAEFLAERRCYLVQGYLFARPLPSADFTALVDSGLPGESILARIGSLADAVICDGSDSNIQ